MGKQYRARVFRSGNSVALRLPKKFGFVEGDELEIVVHDDGRASFWRVQDSKQVLMSLYGSMSSGFMADGRGDVEQDERDWTSGGAPSQAA